MIKKKTSKKFHFYHSCDDQIHVWNRCKWKWNEFQHSIKKRREKKQSFCYKSLISKAQCVSTGTCISISILNQVFNIPVCLSLFISDFKTFHRFSCLSFLLLCTLFRSLNLLHDEIKYIKTNVDFFLISHEIKSHSLLKCVYSLHMHLEDVKKGKTNSTTHQQRMMDSIYDIRLWHIWLYR